MPDGVTCCGEEMLTSNGRFHCRKCQKRLLLYPAGKEAKVIADLIVSYVDEIDPTWGSFEYIIHELWKQGHYEGYEPQLPPEWRTAEPAPLIDRFDISMTGAG